MAWMQQMYSQYLNQYLLYMHSGAVNFVQPDLGVDSVQAGLQVQREQVGRPDIPVAIFQWVRDVDTGSDFFPSRIKIKEFKYFNPKNCFLSFRKYDPSFSSRISDPDRNLLPIPDFGVKKAPDPRSGSATLLFFIPVI
jgi:hypothetical protein